MAILDFDTNQAAESEGGDFEPLPEGRYLVTLQAAEAKQTKDNSGTYVNVKFRVDGPSHSGRVFFEKYNIVNRNEKAEQIGRGQIARLLVACDLAGERDTDLLIGKQCEVFLGIKQDPGYDARNFVKRVSALSGVAKPPGAVSKSQATAAPPRAEAPKRKAF